MGGPTLLSRAILITGLSLLLGCMDKGIVGATSPCTSACTRGEVCHPTLLRCVECAKTSDCASKNNGDLPYCDSNSSSCVQCRDKHDCQDPTPSCVAGVCQQKSDDNAGQGGDDGAGHSSDDSAGHSG